MSVARSGTAIFEAKDFIALQGRKGAAWTAVVRHLLNSGFEAEKLRHNLLINVLVKKHGFKVENKGDIIITMETLSSIKVILYAPLMESWKSYGLKNFVDVPTGPTLSILEALGQAREEGVVITELSKQLKIKSIHPLIDKLITLELIHKRIVFPVSKAKRNSRGCTSRTNIIHLNRFTSSYDPTKDSLSFQVEDSTIESLCHKIAKFIREENVTVITSKKIGEEFSFAPKQMVTLREKVNVVGDRNSSSFPIRFFTEDELCSNRNLYASDYNNGQKKWFVSLSNTEKGDVDNQGWLGEGSFMNLPYYEQSLYHLNSSKTGITNSDLRIKLGLERAKRAYKISSDLVSLYNVYSIKTMEGKQQSHRLLGVAAAMEESNRSAKLIECSNEDSQTGDLEKQLAENKISAMKNTNQRQKERIDTILHDLRTHNGVRSRIEIHRRIQEVESGRGLTELMDRKSLLRILDMMSSERLLVMRKVTLPPSQNQTVGTETDIIVYTANNENIVDGKIQEYLHDYELEQLRRVKELSKKHHMKRKRKKGSGKKSLEQLGRKKSKPLVAPGTSTDESDSSHDPSDDLSDELSSESVGENECYYGKVQRSLAGRSPKDEIDSGFDRLKPHNICKYILGLRCPGFVQTSKNLHCILYRIYVEIQQSNFEVTLDDIILKIPLRFAIKNYGIPRSQIYRLVNVDRNKNDYSVDTFINTENALSTSVKKNGSFSIEDFVGFLNENKNDTAICYELVDYVRDLIERDANFLVKLNILELCHVSNGCERKYRLSDIVDSWGSEREIAAYWEQEIEPLLSDRMAGGDGSQFNPAHNHIEESWIKSLSESSFKKASYDRSLVSQLYKDLCINNRNKGPSTKRKRNSNGSVTMIVQPKVVQAESESDGDDDNDEDDDLWSPTEDARLIQTFMVGLLKREAAKIPDSVRVEFNSIDNDKCILDDARRTLINSSPNASYPFNSILYPNFGFYRFPHNFAFGFNRSTYANSGNNKSFLSAKKRLHHLLQMHNRLQDIVALVMNSRALYNDRSPGQLLNQVLIKNVNRSTQVQENVLDAVSYIIRMCSMEDFQKYPDHTKTAISTYTDKTYRNVCRDLINSKWLSLDSNTKFFGELWLPLKISNTLGSSLRGAFTRPIKDMYALSNSKPIVVEKTIVGKENDDECTSFDSFEIAHSLASLNLDSHLEVLTEAVENCSSVIYGGTMAHSTKKISVGKCHSQLFKDSLNRINVVSAYNPIVEFNLLDLEISSDNEAQGVIGGDKFNRELTHTFLSKIHSLLIEYPGCTIQEIHAMAPTVSERHAKFLVHELISHNLAFLKEVPENIKLMDFFAVNIPFKAKAITEHYFANSLPSSGIPIEL